MFRPSPSRVLGRLFSSASRATTAPQSRPESTPQTSQSPLEHRERVVIENVRPCVWHGEQPIKCAKNHELVVRAEIYKDGHDLIGARLRVWDPPRKAEEGDSQPAARSRTLPMSYDAVRDEWSGVILPSQLGRMRFTVEAWPDAWGTYCFELRKRMDAGQDVSDELPEAAVLLQRAAPSRKNNVRDELLALAKVLEDEDLPVKERIARATDPHIAGLLAGPLEPEQLTRHEPALLLLCDREIASFAAWYEFFPRSIGAGEGRHGTFADAARFLDEVAAMGFDVVYLPPIHPIGTHQRKGRNNSQVAEPQDVGSPWAIGSSAGGHTAVHPQLGTLDDFASFVDRAQELGIEVALDYALQCAPDHPWVSEHPDWFHQRRDGSIRYAENPPKKYQDIYPLDFWCEDRVALWEACRDVLLFWIERGVRTFRVDNPHTKPFAFWEWVLGDVQSRYPDTVFLAEAFTRPHRMQGLAKIGFNQSYTYFTWKNGAQELSEYMQELTDPEISSYFRPHFFVNTPDILNEYLQTGGPPAFRIRLLLAATLSPLYGVYSGYEFFENVAVRSGSEEYLDSEKYQLRNRDHSATPNLKQEIRVLNRIRREHACLQSLTPGLAVLADNPQVFAYLRGEGRTALLVIANTDPEGPQHSFVHVPTEAWGLGPDEPYDVEDILTGDSYTWSGSRNYVHLDPHVRVGHVLRLVGHGDDARGVAQ